LPGDRNSTASPIMERVISLKALLSSFEAISAIKTVDS
jgi:hypothetical protein